MESELLPELRVEIDEEELTGDLIVNVIRLLEELQLPASAKDVRQAKASDRDDWSFGVMPWGERDNEQQLSFHPNHLSGLTVVIKPSDLDRAKPEHEAVYRKCVALVQFMTEVPDPEVADGIRIGQFFCYTADGADEQWAPLAKIWKGESD